MFRDVVIVVPCYREQDTIPTLLYNVYNSILRSANLLFVDDSEDCISTIMAYRWIEENKDKSLSITCLSQGIKSGRGQSVIKGFENALTNKQIRTFIEMDADGSHQISDVIKVLDQSNSFEVVIGSRYLQESRILGWSMRRRILSKFLNTLIPFIFGIQVSDVTNGLRAYSRAAVESLVKSDFQTNTFISLTESILILRKSGLAIAEVPIVFANRTSGKSTVGIQELYVSLTGLVKLLKNRKKLM